MFIPTLFLKKQRGYCNRLRPPPPPPVRYTIFSNQIWRISYSHELGATQQNNFGPRSLGLWVGVQWSNIIKLQ